MTPMPEPMLVDVDASPDVSHDAARQMPSEVRPTIRVLRAITRLNIGGPAQQAILLSHALERRGMESLLVIGRPSAREGELVEWLHRYPARWVRLPTLQRALHPVHDLRAWWGFQRVIRAARPTVVHTHMAKAGALGRSAALWYRWRTGRPVVLLHTFHGHVLEGYFTGWHAKLFLSIERWLGRRTDCLIAINESVRCDLIALGIGTPDKIRVIPLGFELDDLLELGPPAGDGSRLGIVGRLVPIKRHELLFRALARVRQMTSRPMQCRVIGDGELRDHLEQFSRQLGLESMVQFTGWQHDRAAMYQDLDIVCLTSLNEGTPVALIEALAAGRAVVATDVGGVRELLGKTRVAALSVPSGVEVLERGLIVAGGDADAFARALELLMATPTLREEIGRAGRAFVAERFAFARLEHEIAALYRTLLAPTDSPEVVDGNP